MSGRNEGLALAGFHLGDLALVERDAAQKLDIEVTHAQLALGNLAGRGEDLGQGIVQHVTKVSQIVLLARPANLASSFGALVLQLLGRRLGRSRILKNLGTQRRHPLADLIVG